MISRITKAALEPSSPHPIASRRGMEREETNVSDFAQELKDRLRFSHVVLKRTKADLVAAKRAAEKKKEKSERRIQVLEEECQLYRGKHKEGQRKVTSLKNRDKEQAHIQDCLRKTVAAKEAELRGCREEQERWMDHWERRFQTLREENAELMQRSARYQSELQNVKAVSQKRFLEDEKRIRELEESLEDSRRQVACLPSLLEENAELKRALEDGQNNQSCPCDAEISPSEDDWRLSLDFVPNPAVDLFEAFHRRHIDRSCEKKIRNDYRRLMHDVHKVYQTIGKRHLQEAKARYQKSTQTLRRRYQQQTPYGRVLDFEKIAFYRRQLRRLHQSLDASDTLCGKALRSTAENLMNVAKNLERLHLSGDLSHVQ